MRRGRLRETALHRDCLLHLLLRRTTIAADCFLHFGWREFNEFDMRARGGLRIASRDRAVALRHFQRS